jgi:hypothetical protein
VPAEHVVDDSRGIVQSRAWGKLTDDDLLEHQRRVREDPHFQPDLNQLFDFRDVEDVALTAHGIDTLAERNPFGRGAKRAFVIRPGALAMYGLMRMFQTLTSEHPDELRVQFDDIEAAKSWLGMTNL